MGMELGPFLRSRREALAPSDVGLVAGPRRRTPGLRRAELATLAGISVDYLIRIEQGRDRHPSGQVLAALADALRLDADDREQLRRIAAASFGPGLCPDRTSPPTRQVRPTVRALLDRLEPSPALVLNRLGDLLAWTVAYEALAGPVGILDGDPPNLALFAFCDPRARDAFPDWATVADEQVGHLRSVCPTSGPEAERLLTRLVDSGADFADRWSSPVLARRRTGVTRFAHPEAGELRLAFETLDLGGDDQWLIAYLPADEATGVAVDLVTGRRPGGLRAVGD